MSFVSDLDPTSLWRYFDEILEIPRPSKNEGKIREYIIGIADRLGLEHKTDVAGNVVVRKPATSGKEQAPTTVFQAHLDMVLEKNSDVDHDFEKDPIRPQRDGEYLKATGTTLGADNGIGIASMLALLEADDLVHGPLEMLFTVDEETGLTGAAALASDLLEGRILINCDSEEEGVLTIGCAGGGDTHLYVPLSRSSVPGDAVGLNVHLSGLKGGHSGIDIHLQRGNALKLLVRGLDAALAERPLRVARLAGGNAHNAIPRESTATLVVSPGDLQTVKSVLERTFEDIRKEFRPAEPGMEFSLEEVAAPKDAWDDASTSKMLAFVMGLPHGVTSMSYDIPDLVETSTNLAVVDETDGQLRVLMSSRSSVDTALEALRQQIAATGRLAGARVDEHDSYPGWQPNVKSSVLELVKKVHEDVAGHAAKIGAVHAGLECGIIGEKYPGMDMISVGPQIEFPHSPDERVKIPSVATFYRIVTTTLERLAG